ncbi:MAG: EVE domain-containing protein [Phycisphaerales bacterium]|nr:EVE domain-containing protein [Phycisphaerales bacterium]
MGRRAAVRQCWLVKSEPDCYSIDDLERDQRTFWDGVRNYQARNFMRDQMRAGDGVLYHHSGADPPGIVGIARISREAYPDHTALDPKADHFDPKASRDNPIWFMVDLEFVEKFPRVVTMKELKERPELEGLPLLQRGQRLSVMSVDPRHFEIIRRLGRP